MVELLKFTDKIDKFREKYAQFFSAVEDDYLDKRSAIEDICTYTYENDGVETSYVDKEQLIELNDECINELTDVFDTISEKNKKEYDFLLRLMYHDYVMMFEYDGDLTPEEKEEINKIELDDDDLIADLDALKEYLKNNPNFYTVLIDYFIKFSNLNYYEARKLYYDNENRDRYLFNFFNCHLIDKLYFTKTITSDELIDEFNNGEMVAQAEIITKLQDLQEYDTNNYEKLLSELLENFYKNTSYKRSVGMCEDVNYNLLTLLETGDIKLLKNNITEEFNSLKCLIQELYNDKILYDEKFKEKANKYYSINGQKVKEKILRKTK